MLYWDMFTARGWVAFFVFFHYWGSFVTSSNDCILTPLLCLLLPFGMRDAEHRSPKNLWNSSRWFASGASLTISVASAQVRPSQFPIDDGPLLATGLPPMFSFHVLMSIPTIDWNPLFNTIACIEFRRLKRLHPIYLVSMKTCRLCACFVSINLYHSFCRSLIVYFYLCWIASAILPDSDNHILNFTLANSLANVNCSFVHSCIFQMHFVVCTLHFSWHTIRNMILRTLRWLKPRFVSVDFVVIKHWPFTYCVSLIHSLVSISFLCLHHNVVCQPIRFVNSIAYFIWSNGYNTMECRIPATWFCGAQSWWCKLWWIHWDYSTAFSITTICKGYKGTDQLSFSRATQQSQT